jgi:hypothetical protein
MKESETFQVFSFEPFMLKVQMNLAGRVVIAQTASLAGTYR